MQTPTQPTPGDFDLEHFLPYRLSLLTNTVSQGIAAVYSGVHGISVTEWRVLAVLGRYPGLAAFELVERTAMDKVAVHRAVKSLEARGLLERRTDSGDGRRRRLYLTRPRGEELREAIVPQAKAFEQRLLDSLTPKEIEHLDRLLAKLQRAAGEARANASPVT
jgi:DNA-binding MarR family transcriptional regulator